MLASHLRVGQPAAVGAPGVVADLGLRAPVDLHRRTAGAGHHEQRVGLVGVRDPLAVWRRARWEVPAGLAGGFQDLGLLAAPGVDAADLLLTRCVADVQDLIPAGFECRPVLTGSGAAGHGQRHALLHWDRYDLAAGHDRHARAVRGEVVPGHEPPGVGVAHARQRAVARQLDRQLLHGAALRIEQRDVAGEHEDDPPVGPHRRPARVPRAEVGVLLAVAAVRLHRPEVLRPALVGEEPEPAARPHREGLGDVLPGDAAEVGRLRIADPEVLRRAAAVALPGAELVADPVEGVGPRDRIDVQPRGPAERELHGLVARCISRERDREQLPAARPERARAPDDDRAAVGHPADYLVGHRVPGQAARLAAGDRHDVDVAVAVVLAREGDQLPVGGEGREVLVAGRGRQPPARAPRVRGQPQVGFGGEDDEVPVDVGVPQVAGCGPGGRVGCGDEGGQTGEEGEQDDESGGEAGTRAHDTSGAGSSRAILREEVGAAPPAAGVRSPRAAPGAWQTAASEPFRPAVR